MSVEAVDLHKVDGDPRKMTGVALHLARKYPEAIEFWRKSPGLYERVLAPKENFEAAKHKHNVMGHMFGGTMFVEAIGESLQERSYLTGEKTRETGLSSLLHDADKPTDMKFIIMAMGGKDGNDEVSWKKVEDIIQTTDLENKDKLIENLKLSYEKYFSNDVSIGNRVHVARAGIAGAVHRARLAQAGFSDRVIEIQSATEYTGCDEIDYLIDKFWQMSPTIKTLALQKTIICYMDNGMMNSEMVDVEVRTVAVFKKPINVALSEAYVEWNEKKETAEAKQIRVGKKIEAFLAGLIGVDPENFLRYLEAKVRAKISSV